MTLNYTAIYYYKVYSVYFSVFFYVELRFNEDGDNNRGGMDTDAVLSDSWWERVKYYARLAIERFVYGVESVKELLSTLTIDERLGVMLEFEDLDLTNLLNW